MRTYLIGFLLALGPLGVFAQVGITAYGLSDYAPDWTTTTLDPPMGKGVLFGIDYRFRLKNVRVEFLPTLAYSEQMARYGDTFIRILGVDFKTTGAHFLFNTNFYLFDFAGDCDCPTFSKSNPIFKKGFFVQLSPGISRFSFSLKDRSTGTTEERKQTNTAFSIGVGTGLDVGISNVFTITPHVQLRYYPSVSWPDLTELRGSYTALSETSNLWQYYAGLRFGIRLDYRR